jgi:hypothetical protein
VKKSFFRSELGKKVIAIIISIAFPLGVVLLIILIEVFTKMFAK